MKYVGLVYSNETDENSDETKENINDRLANIGAVGRIVQASKHSNDPMHIIVQVMERFEIIEINSEDHVYRVKVEYLNLMIQEIEQLSKLICKTV